jgi:ectoine hydroxylase-related dioxygenase (phytanoyl-CoA dioxygenase family)
VVESNIPHSFRETGVVRLEGAFPPAVADQMANAIWGYAERKAGIRRDEPASWPDGSLGLSWKGLKRNPAFNHLLDNDAVRAALAAVFGPSQWRQPNPGAQVLLTLPSPGEWVLPATWHMDCGFEQPSWPVHGVKLFAFFGEVGPKGGGTMVLPGSHRVVDKYRRSLPPGTGGGMANWHRLLRQHPFLAQLLNGDRMSDGGRLLVGQLGDVDGVPVEVRELTGKPGDVVITHLHVYHAASPNVSGVPRQMLGKAIYRAAD